MKTALITGVTGQDGAYLAEFLLEKGYTVHGIKRRSSLINTDRIDHLYEDSYQHNRRFIMHYGDMTDSLNLTAIIQKVQPDEIYNLAAMSHVKVSFEEPEYTANADGIGTLRVLEAVRLLGLTEKTRIYQASTSELYGLVQEVPQSERTPFYPRSPYAVAKLYAYWITVNYREAYNMFACNGILFNHESPVRGETFVTRKITRGVAQTALGLENKLFMGNIDAKRDWGHAKDYVEAMWLILQQEIPEDYVIATGITTSVRNFIIKAYNEVGIEIAFKGQGVDEIGFISSIDNAKYGRITNHIIGKYGKLKEGQEIIFINERNFRPTEVELLIGDATKAETKLGWKPKHDLNSLVNDMISSDIILFRSQLISESEGLRIKQIAD